MPTADRPVSIPTSIDVGPFTFTVSDDADALGRWKAKDGQPDLAGRYDEATQTITVDGSYAVGYQREVLLHETLHAVFGVTGLEFDHDEKDEERLIRRLCPALLDLLRRNPALVAYLTAKEN